MNLRRLWSKLAHSDTKTTARKFYSLVLLLREPSHLTQEQLVTAGSRAWDQTFNASEDAAFFVVQDGKVTFMKCGPFLINLLQAQKPYTPPNREDILKTADENAQLAWSEHTAWSAFDLLNDYDFSAEQSFGALARWAQPFLSANCTAVFIPSLGRTLVNNGAADHGLKILIDLEDGATK